MTRFRTETGSAPSGSEGIREDRERLRADNAALKQQLDVMRALAFRDQLTGLFSRHYLTDYLEQEIERMSGEANIVLALCDIDDFKLINDVRGHQAGDIAIVCIADILDDLSGNHPVIRWGGEELLLVLFSTPDHEALRLCNQMREEVASYPISDDLGDFSCTLTFGLSAYDARHLVEHRATADFFEACMELAGADAAKLAKPVANLVINDVTAYLNAHEGVQLADTPLTPARALALVRLTAEDAISSKQAKEVFAAVLDEDKDPAAIVEERGMKQVSDTGAIEAVVDAVLAANPDKVAQYQGGKTGLIGFFVGQCMKEMRGQGNPKLINELLAKKLG